MPATFATWLAIISTIAFLGLWFWVVYGELALRRNTVESAKIQVLACRRECAQGSAGSEKEAAAREVLLRSEDIYRQSVALYHRALKKPWNYIPGRLMCFHPISRHEY